MGIFPVHLTTSRIVNFTRVDPYPCYMYGHTYIPGMYLLLLVGWGKKDLKNVEMFLFVPELKMMILSRYFFSLKTKKPK